MNKLEQMLEYSFSGWKQFSVVVGAIFVCSFAFGMVITKPHATTNLVEQTVVKRITEIAGIQADSNVAINTASVQSAQADTKINELSTQKVNKSEKKIISDRQIDRETDERSQETGATNNRNSYVLAKMREKPLTSSKKTITNAFAATENTSKSRSNPAGNQGSVPTSSSSSGQNVSSATGDVNPIVERATDSNNTTYAEALEATGRLAEIRDRMCVNAQRYNNAEQLELAKAALAEAGCNI